MFQQLTDRFSGIVRRMRGEARLTETNMQEMLREVRLALLEADVALPVVRDFLARVRERALGQEVAASLTPGQALVGVVNDELKTLLGSGMAPAQREINLAVQPPAVLLLAGLQGAGKTTTVGKLGRWIAQNRRKKVLAVSTDIHRPAAIAQLATVCEQADIGFFPTPEGADPVRIAQEAIEHARRHLLDVVIVDTAGRTSVDEAMMDEIARLHAAVHPIETLYVADAMLGQDAVRTATAFGERIALTGVVLTKLDGDARGGAALSVVHATGRPIKFAGVGEKNDAFEPFDPDRMAGRVLGMGDIVALVEDVRRSIDTDEAGKLAARMQSGARFTLDDFLVQVTQMRRMGGMGGLMDKLPAQLSQAAGKVDPKDADKQIRRMEGIIRSMTPQERHKPELIKASRKRRIASGAGVQVQDVNRMLGQFEQVESMMKMMRKGGLGKMMRAMGGMGGFPGMPGGRPRG